MGQSAVLPPLAWPLAQSGRAGAGASPTARARAFAGGEQGCEGVEAGGYPLEPPLNVTGRSDGNLEMCHRTGFKPTTYRRHWPISAAASRSSRESGRPPCPTWINQGFAAAGQPKRQGMSQNDPDRRGWTSRARRHVEGQQPVAGDQS